MKKWSVLLGLFVIILIGGYLGLSYYGVKLIQPQLQKVLGPGVALKEIQLRLTHLSIKGIQYEGLHTKKKYLWVEEIKIYPAILSLFIGPLRIRDVTIREPSLSFYRTKEGVFVGPWAGPEKKEKREPPGDQEQKEREQVFLRIDRLRIQKGSVDFEDWKPGEPPAWLRLSEMDLDMKEIQYPFHSTRSPVELKGRLEEKTKKGGEIHIKGWINLKTTDMETSLNVREIEVKLFEPYYRKKVSAEIDSGYMAMDAKISLKEKFIDAPGKLELVHLHIKEGEGTVFWIPAKTLISLLKEKGDRIQVSFHMKGSLGDPKFNLQETLLTRIALSLLEALGLPIKVVGEGVLEKTIKGEKGMIEELRDLERQFKKKKKKQ
jgi:Domain of Unknown Function (DUF748)